MSKSVVEQAKDAALAGIEADFGKVYDRVLPIYRHAQQGNPKKRKVKVIVKQKEKKG